MLAVVAFFAAVLFVERLAEFLAVLLDVLFVAVFLADVDFFVVLWAVAVDAMNANPNKKTIFLRTRILKLETID